MIKKNFIIIVLVLLSSIVNAVKIDGVSFKKEYTLGKQKLLLRGYSTLNYMLFIKAYTGAFYLKSEIASDQALSETPRIIQLYYFHKISAADFRNATIEMIKKNTTAVEFQKIKDQVDTFNGLYKDVKPGDRYTASYLPGHGTTLYLNKEALGTIKGSEFSKAFFSIWIGEEPIDEKFRDRLLGKK
ncbi:MAG: chalcone isomerase family protein [Candidatus Brocadiae bacterium]|nr:chalcone isomerase family protein [Candidatus Brocadiia bacterium]